MRGGAVESVVFVNVPSYVVERGEVELAWGGALYASVPASAFGLRVAPDDLTALIAAGREVKARCPERDVYGTILWEELGPLHQRNVTVFADGEVDRSPCGSGTSARLVLLGLEPGETLRHDSIVGTTFLGRVVGETDEGVLTEVEGIAHRTGEHVFVLDPRDELGTGFVLR
jgi:proline racemase